MVQPRIRPVPKIMAQRPADYIGGMNGEANPDRYEVTDASVLDQVLGATPHLDDRHSVFGRVVEGMEVVRSLRERDPQRDRNPGDRIETIEITES